MIKLMFYRINNIVKFLKKLMVIFVLIEYIEGHIHHKEIAY